MGLDHGFSLTSWHWSTRERRLGTWDQWAAIYQNANYSAVIPLFAPSHPSLGIHDISNAWRGRLRNPRDPSSMMLATHLPQRLALRLDARARPVHGPWPRRQARGGRESSRPVSAWHHVANKELMERASCHSPPEEGRLAVRLVPASRRRGLCGKPTIRSLIPVLPSITPLVSEKGCILPATLFILERLPVTGRFVRMGTPITV